MRGRLKSLLFLTALILILIVSACSSGTNNNGNSSTSNGKEAQSNNDSAAVDAGNTSNDSSQPVEKGEPLGKYDPQITLTSSLVTPGWAKLPPGDTMTNDNRWHKLIREKLGIDVQWTWQADPSQYENKVNVTIASGDLPDIMAVTKKQLNQLVEAGMVEDLTQAFDQYAMPLMQEQVKKELAPAQSLATYNGKLMAIPQYGGDPRGPAGFLYIRTDWLDNLGLSKPKTMDDVIKIAEAFTKQDPDKDNKNDTYGLGILPITSPSGGSMLGFMNGYHGYPDIWVTDNSGKLVNGSIQPEMKVALGKLQEMYKDGLIDREFATKKYDQLKEDVVSGKVGMFYGNVSESATYLVDAMKSNPKALWAAVPLPSVDDQPAKPSVPNNVGQFYVVKKGYEHPEALVKLMNLFITITYGEDGKGKNAQSNVYVWADGGYVVHAESPVLTYISTDSYTPVKKARQSGDTSALTEDEKKAYDIVKSYDGSKLDDWQTWWIYQTDVSPFEVLHQYLDDPNGTLVDKFFGGSTPTMDTKASTLKDMEDEEFIKIIMNGASIDEFDKFVDNWKKLGGEQITKEVNEWYDKNK